MDTGYISTVTITEFLVWYSTGELRIHRRRLLPISLESNGTPKKDETVCRQIMEMLPHVDLEDEHNILVVTLMRDPIQAADQTGYDHYPLLFDMAYVTSESILSIQPLTQRGGEIIKARLYDLDLRLEPPMFEKETKRLWHEWSIRRSIKGAEAMVSLAVKKPSFKPSPEFMKQAERSIYLLNEQQETSPYGDLLVYVMCYNRHDAIPDQDIGYLIDLGIVLSQFEKNLPEIQPIVDQVRQFCKAFKKNNDSRKLSELLRVSDVRKTFLDFQKECNSELDLGAAALFLKWKYLMQRTQRLEIRNILNDVRDCYGKVAKLTVEKALWLLGYYCGFDQIAKEYYMRAEYGRYRFLEKRVITEPVELEVEIVEATVQVEKHENVSLTRELNQGSSSDVTVREELLAGEGTKTEDATPYEAGGEASLSSVDKNHIENMINAKNKEQKIKEVTPDYNTQSNSDVESIEKSKNNICSESESVIKASERMPDKRNLNQQEHSESELQQKIDFEDKRSGKNN